MDTSWIKRSVPRSLYGRAALILAVPVLALQVVVSIVFIQRHFDEVTRQMTRGVTLDLRHLLNETEEGATAAEALARTAALRRDLDLDVGLPAADPAPRGTVRRRFYDLSGRALVETLSERLAELRAVDLATSSRHVHIVLDSAHGPMAVTFSRKRVTASNPHQFLVIMGVFGALMTGVAFVYLRNQLRPVTRLAAAADAFGRGRVVPYRPGGALEVRAAGAAFLDMRARIAQQDAQRTMMLSGISHDLRTPLTRLRLALSMLEVDAPAREVAAMARDVAEMEALVEAFLQFARGEVDEARHLCRPTELAAQAVEKARRAGGQVTLRPGADRANVQLSLRRLGVARALDNLIGNAVRYAGRAEVSVTCDADSVRFVVEDDGPGIPLELREEALRPFSRLDAARNQNRGSGVGLGLAIAQDVAAGHGGRLVLGDSRRLGGLRADLVLAV